MVIFNPDLFRTNLGQEIMPLLTDRAIKTAKPKDKAYKLTVDRGLYVNVPLTGKKTWLVRFMLNGKQHHITLPLPYGSGKGFMSLAEACAENSRIQGLAHQGIDFREEEKRQEQEQLKQKNKQIIESLTFLNLFQAWLADGVLREDGNAELIRAFNKDVIPSLGEIPVKDIKESDLRNLLRKMIVERNVKRMAVRVYNDLIQLFKWAEKRQPWRNLLVEGNPADLLDIYPLVGNDYDMDNIRDRTLSDQEIKELYDIFTKMEKDYNNAPTGQKYNTVRPLNKESQLAIWICLSTLCRIGELTMSEWKDINFDDQTWFIPKENIKSTNGKKQDHFILLSPFALEQFKLLHGLTGHTQWCFPNRDKTDHLCTKTITKQIGDRQARFKDRKEQGLSKRRNDDTLVLANGVNGKWTPHDLRRTGATIMQSLKIPLDIIDRCQNHILEGSKVRRHYLQYEYAEEKKEAWDKLGEYLDCSLKSN